ncbi:hypothetical protein ACFTQ7_08210 [Lysinibacillus sp. NPDC056959]|uniref:hypothetical protein n=1 Tax=Lysinibacillus sp. NPDC056959 TaxID=3345981 RepID=UPI003629B551
MDRTSRIVDRNTELTDRTFEATERGRTDKGASQGDNGGNNNQPSYLNVEDDPFANRKESKEVNEDDLPF